MEYLLGIFVVFVIISSIMKNWDKIVEFFIGLLIFAVVIFVLGAILFAIGDEFGAGGVIVTVVGVIVVFYMGIWFISLHEIMERAHKRKIEEKKRKKSNEKKLIENIKAKYLKEINTNDLIKIHNEGKVLDADMLLMLIKNGLDINKQDIDGNTALFTLSQANQAKSIKILLEQGAKLDIKNNDNKTAMDVATLEMKDYFSPYQCIMRDEFELFWKMYQYGMDINFKNSSGQTILHAMVYKDLTLKFYSNSLENLVESDADINATDEYERSPLFYAVIKGNQTAVEKLLQYEPITSLADKEGKTLSDYAKLYKHEKIISLLKMRTKNKNRKSKVLIWLFLVFTFIVISLGFVKVSNPVKDSLLNYSINNGYFQMAGLLNKYGAKYHKKDIFSMTKNNKNINAIKYLLSNSEIDLNKQDEKGKTVLHYAYELTNPETINLLIKYGAKKDVIDKHGRTPCFYAIYNENDKVAPCNSKEWGKE